MAGYTGRLHLKRVPFLSLQYMGRLRLKRVPLLSLQYTKGRESCHLSVMKGSQDQLKSGIDGS